jgi:hypothetical protein
VVIPAAIIAAVRLAREENINRRTRRLLMVVSDAVGLARMILEKCWGDWEQSSGITESVDEVVMIDHLKTSMVVGAL